MHDVKKHGQLQRFATVWNSLIHYIPEGKTYNDRKNVVLFWNFLPAVKDRCEHYSKCKNVSIKFRKILQERRLPILIFSHDNPQKIFLNFLNPKNIFTALQYSRDILGIFLKQTLMECSSNILETITSWLLGSAKIPEFCWTLHWEFSKNYFPLKCSLNVPWMSRTLQNCGNTQRIFPEYYVPAGQ